MSPIVVRCWLPMNRVPPWRDCEYVSYRRLDLRRQLPRRDAGFDAGGRKRFHVERLAQRHRRPAFALGLGVVVEHVLLELLDRLGHALDRRLARDVVAGVAVEL